MDAVFPPKMDMLEVLIHSIPVGQQLWFMAHGPIFDDIVSINIYKYISYYLLYIYTQHINHVQCRIGILDGYI